MVINSNPVQTHQLYFETILKWVRSCNRIDQLPVCRELIEKLFVDRFKDQIPDDELLKMQARLFQALEEREEYMGLCFS